MRPSRLLLLISLTLAATACASASTIRAPSSAPDQGVEAFIDAQMKALAFPLSIVGNVPGKNLKGDAAKQFQLWTDQGGNPQAHALSDNGRALWAVVAGSVDVELGGHFLNYIAIFSADDGALLAQAVCPPSPFKWNSSLDLVSIPKPALYVPALKPAGANDTVASLISTIKEQFDEVSIKSKTYVGHDREGNAMKMTWKMSANSLAVDFLSGSKAIASFKLDSSHPAEETNASQYERDPDSNFLVVKTKDSALWVHTSEGNTIIRIGSSPDFAEFDFYIDHQ
jgi:hypothetical protein